MTGDAAWCWFDTSSGERLSPKLTSAPLRCAEVGRSQCPWHGLRQRGGSRSAPLALAYLAIFELLA